MKGHWPTSGVFVLPTMTAPAARSRRATSPSPRRGWNVPEQPKFGRLAGEVHVVLDRDRDAEQRQRGRPARAAAVGLVGLGARGLGAHAAEGVQLRLARVDARERRVDQLARGRVAGRDERAPARAGRRRRGRRQSFHSRSRLPRSVVRTNDSGTAAILRRISGALTSTPPQATRARESSTRRCARSPRAASAPSATGASRRGGRRARLADLPLPQPDGPAAREPAAVRGGGGRAARGARGRAAPGARRRRRTERRAGGRVVEQVAARDTGRPEEIAELELHLHASRDPALHDASRRCFAAYEEFATAALEALGVPEPERHARTVVALLCGLGVRRLGTGEHAAEGTADALLTVIRGATGAELETPRPAERRVEKCEGMASPNQLIPDQA